MSVRSVFSAMFIQKQEEHERMLQEQEQREAAEQFFEKELRTVTVRLSPFLLAQIDGLAYHLEESRQAILDRIISVGTTEAVEGYSFAFTENDVFTNEFFDTCRQAAREGKTFKELMYKPSTEE